MRFVNIRTGKPYEEPIVTKPWGFSLSYDVYFYISLHWYPRTIELNRFVPVLEREEKRVEVDTVSRSDSLDYTSISTHNDTLISPYNEEIRQNSPSFGYFNTVALINVKSNRSVIRTFRKEHPFVEIYNKFIKQNNEFLLLR